MHTNLARIVYLFVQDTIDVFLRQTRSVVLHRYFHIIRFLGCRDLDFASFLGVLPGILHECIHHEQSQRLVGLHPSFRRTDRQCLLLQFKIPSSFLQDLKQRIQGKVFNIQAQRPLPHLNPQGQDIVVLIDTGNQFPDVLILAFLDFFPRQVIERSKLVDFIHDPIYIRCNAGHQEQASFLYQVLSLVFYQMLLVYILFLLQPTTFIAQLNHGQSILQCPREIRNHHLQQGLVILPAIRPDLHLPIRHHLPFRILQRKQQARFLLHLFIRRINVHIRCTY